MSVRLWNFKDGGCLNARFLPKNQHAQGNFFKNSPAMNYGSPKSAEIDNFLCQKLTEFF